MKGVFLQVGIVLHELETVRCVFAVLGRDVTAHSGNTAVLLLRALKDDLNACFFRFLCHCYASSNTLKVSM